MVLIELDVFSALFLGSLGCFFSVTVFFFLYERMVIQMSEAVARSRSEDPVAHYLEPFAHVELIRTQDGTQLATYSVSRGDCSTTYVLVHGLCCDSRIWSQFVVPGLLRSGNVRIIAYDLRGHGQSDKNAVSITQATLVSDLVDVLRHFGVRNSVLVGHSMGAFNILSFATSNTELESFVSSVCLVSGFASISFGEDRQMPIMPEGIQILSRLATMFGHNLVSILTRKGSPLFASVHRRFFQIFSLSFHLFLQELLAMTDLEMHCWH